MNLSSDEDLFFKFLDETNLKKENEKEKSERKWKENCLSSLKIPSSFRKLNLLALVATDLFIIYDTWTRDLPLTARELKEAFAASRFADSTSGRFQLAIILSLSALGTFFQPFNVSSANTIKIYRHAISPQSS